MNTTSSQDLISLIINFPSLIEKVYIKEEYLQGKDKVMFHIIVAEYEKNKSLVFQNLNKYNSFDTDYFIERLENNLYSSSKDTAIITLQKNIIDDYKNRETERIIKEHEDDYEKIISELEKLKEINYNEVEYITAKDIFKELAKENKKVETTYPKLDYSLNISEHDLVIVAGETGGGKTTFALNLLNRMSKNYQCVYINMEMSKNVLYKRLVSMSSGIEIMKLNNLENLTKEEKQLAKDTMLDLEKRKIMVLNKSFKIDEIKKQIANIKNDKHTIVFVDHIGLIKSTGNSLYEKMTNVAKELRAISLDYNCTIIGLCQLSRESQKNNDEPKLQDLRDSGEIEQSSRKVILLYNTTKDLKSRVYDMKVIIAKNDDGNKLTLPFRFDRYQQTFSEVYN